MKEELEEGTWMGKKLKDLTRQELYEALKHMSGLYSREVLDNLHSSSQIIPDNKK